MTRPNRNAHARHLRDAELQFKLVVAVRTACSFGEQPLAAPSEWVFGRLRVQGSDLSLGAHEVELAASLLEHAVTFGLCLAASQAIKDTLPNPRGSSNANVVAAWEIARLIRNAYAHQPLDPVWSIDPHCRDTTYEIEDVVRLDTHGLNGARVGWQDYGGLLALFLLSRWVRANLLDDPDEPRAKPDAGASETAPRVFQYGRMLFRSIDAATTNAPILDVSDGPVRFDMPDGPYTLGRAGDDRPPRVIP